jgi:hypothetical protein
MALVLLLIKEMGIIKILTKKDLLEVLPFGKTKLNELLISNILPVTKVGKDYITTEERINDWINENIGKDIKY